MRFCFCIDAYTRAWSCTAACASERRISNLTLQAQEELEAKDLDDSDEIEDKEYSRGVGGSSEISRRSGNGDNEGDLSADQRIRIRRESAGDKDVEDGERDNRNPDRLMTVSTVSKSQNNTPNFK